MWTGWRYHEFISNESPPKMLLATHTGTSSSSSYFFCLEMGGAFQRLLMPVDRIELEMEVRAWRRRDLAREMAYHVHLLSKCCRPFFLTVALRPSCVYTKSRRDVCTRVVTTTTSNQLSTLRCTTVSFKAVKKSKANKKKVNLRIKNVLLSTTVLYIY
jgi:hypothetical protein